MQYQERNKKSNYSATQPDGIKSCRNPAGLRILPSRVIMMHDGGIYSARDPASVLSIENIKKVYGVEVEVSNRNERPHIIPIRTTNENGE